MEECRPFWWPAIIPFVQPKEKIGKQILLPEIMFLVEKLLAFPHKSNISLNNNTIN